MTAAILQGLTRNSGIDSVGSITPVDTIAALRALTNAPDTPGNPGLDHPKIVAVDGWATKGDSWQGFLECVGPATSASFTGTGSVIGISSGFANQFVVTSVTGAISIGDAVTGTGAQSGTVFVYQASGTTGGAGTYYTNYLVLAVSGSFTSSSDNGATQFVDASSRLWVRLWNKTDFPAEWAGIFASNADNGPLIGRVPKYTTCTLPVADTLNPNTLANTNALTFQTFPTNEQFSNVKWRGFSTVFSAAGSLGDAQPLSVPQLNQVAFDWCYVPSRNTQFTGPAAGTGPVYDMTGTGINGIENITIVGQLGYNYGIGLRLGSAPAPIQFTGSINGTVLTVISIPVNAIVIGTNYVFGYGMPPGVYIASFGTGTGGVGTYNLSQNCGVISSEGMTLNAAIAETQYVNNLFSRPSGISVTGFTLGILYGSPALHTFVTGLDAFTIKQCQLGINVYCPNGFDSGENLLFTRGALIGTVSDAFNITELAKGTIDSTSFDYNHRNGFFTNAAVIMKNVYHETNSTGTPFNLYVISVETRLTFDSDTSFLGLPYAPSDLILIFDQAVVNFDNPVYYDQGAIPVFTPSTLRQFVNTVAADNIYGGIRGFNGINFVPALSPGSLMNPDFGFASGGLTFYPGSTGCTNQTSVKPPGATNAILMSNTASFPFPAMDVTPGMIVYMTILDQLSGTLGVLGGNMNFLTDDGIAISSIPISITCGVPNWFGAYSMNILAPFFTTTDRAGWTQQQFAFRVPAGASKMTGNIATTVGAVIFNPNDKASNVVLSGGNLTARISSGSVGAVRANGGITTGTFYCSFLPTLGSGNIGVGLANTFADLGNFLGGDANSIAYDSSGNVSLNGAHVATIAAFTSAQPVDMAVRIASPSDAAIFFRANGGNWNNDPSADPVANVGGIPITGLASIGAIPFLPVVESTATNATVTGQFSGSYTHAAPAGYGNITAASSYYIGDLAIYGKNTNG